MRDGIYNAHIKNTFLGVEDHGMFIWTVFVEYGEGSQQGYQRILASKIEAEPVTIIRKLLEAVGVESWEQLKGRYCRVRLENGLIRAMGHITREQWNDVEPPNDEDEDA